MAQQGGLTADPALSGDGFEPPPNRRWWFAYHAAIAPFGILATTWALAGWHNSVNWPIWRHRDAAADMVQLGAVVYAALAVSAEGAIRVVFWAIEQWRKDRERHRRELVNEIRGAVIEELRADVRTQVRNEVLDEIADMARRQPQSDALALVDAARAAQRR